jgi:flagellar biosynthesis/type III secretory pathway protein FliH
MSARIPAADPRGRGAHRASGAWLPVERLRAREQAEQLLAEARGEAERLVAGAQREAEAVRARAELCGLEEGRRRAAEAVAAALRLEAEAVTRLLPELARLAVAMARRLLGEELALRPEAAVAACRRVLGACRAGRSLSVRVHPDDLAARPEAYRELGRALDLELVLEADPQVGRGGCRVLGEWGEVDGRLEVQLGHLEAALAGSASGPSSRGGRDR